MMQDVTDRLVYVTVFFINTQRSITISCVVFTAWGFTVMRHKSCPCTEITISSFSSKRLSLYIVSPFDLMLYLKYDIFIKNQKSIFIGILVET